MELLGYHMKDAQEMVILININCKELDIST